MPRGPRLDAEGILHHVRARGIERRSIFLSDDDRREFLSRLNEACIKSGATLYGWCLMSNHFHLVIRTGIKPLAWTMRNVLSGYATAFNLRTRRSGYLFQNRFKSTVVDEDEYFLNLIRYVHLNPVRAGVIDGIAQLHKYAWTGHAALMDGKRLACHDAEYVLRYFGSTPRQSQAELCKFMAEAPSKKEQEQFKGGGLVRRRARGRAELSYFICEKTAKDWISRPVRVPRSCLEDEGCGPSVSANTSWYQTSSSCCAQKVWW